MQKVKVFISSTFKDLEHYRTEVDKTIRVLDSESISMEHFGSDHRKPLDVCLRAIDDCELFVGIYALRYGFIPPNETRSITELEYLHAVAKGKPILAFVAKDTIQYEAAYLSEGVSTDPDDIKKLHAFKTQIGLDRVIREFVTMDELGKYMAIDLGKYYVKIIRGKALSNPIAHLPLPKGIFYPTVSPYVGLRYFSRQEAKVFYGRNQMIFDLYNALQQEEPIVLVYGQTGVGKSSVLEAGLLPRVEAQGWKVKTLRRQKEQGLPLQWQTALQNWNAPKRLLVIDQAEELWTLPHPDLTTERQDFFAALRPMIGSYDPNSKLIISFRKEFLAEMETGLREQNLPHLKVLVKPMNQPELMEAITQVQEDKDAYDRYRISIHEDLPHEMAYDLRRDDQSHLAPLLQATLSRMWALARAKNPDGVLTFDQALYNRVKTESLEAFLHEQLHQIAQQQPEAVQSGLVLDILHYLTTEMGTAAQCTLTDLHTRYPHVAQLEALVAACENAYLLLKTNTQTIRLSHDALAPLVQKAYRLSEAPGPKAARILEAKDLGQHTEEHFTEAEITTLQTGQQGMRQWREAEQKAITQTQAQITHRRQQIQAQRQATLRALSNGLVKDAKLAEGQKEYSKAIRLAEKAWEVDNNNPKSWNAFTKMHGNLPNYVELQGHADWVNYTIFSPDGQLILTKSDDETTRLWDTSGKLLAVFMDDVARFSPNGHYILTIHKKRTARLWDASGNPLTVLEGHTGLINSAVFSPEGQLILTASNDKTARLWDASGKLIAVLEGHTSGVYYAIFLPDSQLILTADDNTARLWDVSGKPLTVFERDYAVFSPDGQLILTVQQEGDVLWGYSTIRLWDVSGNHVAVLEGHTGWVKSAVFSSDGQLILTVSDDKTARLWDVSGNPVAVLEGHTGLINSAVFSPDNRLILTRSNGETTRLWDASGDLLAVWEGHIDCVNSAVFSPDSQLILTASDDNTARLWDVSGKPLTVLEGHTDGIYSTIFSPDSQRILTVSEDKTTRLWDSSGDLLAVLEGHTGGVNYVSRDGQYFLSHTDRVFADFSPDGQLILTVSDDKTARLWDASGKPLTVLELYTDSVKSAVFSPDGHRILAVYLDFAYFDDFLYAGHRSFEDMPTVTARLWDASGKPVAVFKGHTDYIKFAIFSPDGQRILTASENETASLWDASGDLLAVLEGHIDWVNSAVFSPDGQLILTASWDKTARLWDVSGNPLTVLEGHTGLINSADFSPDGQLILTASDDKTVRLWDISGNHVAILEGHTGWVKSAVFSSDGQLILTASDDKTARLWDVSGNPVAVLEGHTSLINSAVFSPDNRLILTASNDNTARLWDVSGNPVAVLEGHTDYVKSAIFSPDGQLILTASRDTTARLWVLNPQIIIEDINKRHIRVLTWEELKEYDIDNIEKAAGMNREEELLVAEPHEMRLYHYARYYYEIARTEASLQVEYAKKSLRLYDKLIAFMPLQYYQEEREKVLELLKNKF